jgi:hypothetical protein
MSENKCLEEPSTHQSKFGQMPQRMSKQYILVLRMSKTPSSPSTLYLSMLQYSSRLDSNHQESEVPCCALPRVHGPSATSTPPARLHFLSPTTIAAGIIPSEQLPGTRANHRLRNKPLTTKPPLAPTSARCNQKNRLAHPSSQHLRHSSRPK